MPSILQRSFLPSLNPSLPSFIGPLSPPLTREDPIANPVARVVRSHSASRAYDDLVREEEPPSYFEGGISPPLYSKLSLTKRGRGWLMRKLIPTCVRDYPIDLRETIQARRELIEIYENKVTKKKTLLNPLVKARKAAFAKVIQNASHGNVLQVHHLSKDINYLETSIEKYEEKIRRYILEIDELKAKLGIR